VEKIKIHLARLDKLRAEQSISYTKIGVSRKKEIIG
jgi:hypothetical protein